MNARPTGSEELPNKFSIYIVIEFFVCGDENIPKITPQCNSLVAHSVTNYNLLSCVRAYRRCVLRTRCRWLRLSWRGDSVCDCVRVRSCNPLCILNQWPEIDNTRKMPPHNRNAFKDLEMENTNQRTHTHTQIASCSNSFGGACLLKSLALLTISSDFRASPHVVRVFCRILSEYRAPQHATMLLNTFNWTKDN